MQGENIHEIEKQLSVDSLTLNGADYYTTNPTEWVASPVISSGESEDVKKILEFGYGSYNKISGNGRNWAFTDISQSGIDYSKALIIQSGRGEVKNNKTYAQDGRGRLVDISQHDLSQNIGGENLVISDIPFSGSSLPTMGTGDSISRQFEGKAGAVIATNGGKINKFLKSLLCSLLLQEGKFGKNDYYWFDSLGDRFRNARNNLVKFGSAADLPYDYSLYGTPFLGVEGKKFSEMELTNLCAGFAEYSVYPASSGFGLAAASNNEEVYTRTVSLDFSGYSIQNVGGFGFIDVNGSVQDISAGKNVLPFAVAEIEFPTGTIIRGIKLLEKSGPVTLDVPNLSSWNGSEFNEKLCTNPDVNSGIEFSMQYKEDSIFVVAKVAPAEIVDCGLGKVKLYREMGFEVEYVLYSPLLIKSVDSGVEYLPNKVADINVSVENITGKNVGGKIRVVDGNSVLAETQIYLAAASKTVEVLSFVTEGEEGFYDYVVEFEQDNEVLAKKNFKVRVDVLGVDLKFGGSKWFVDDFESVPLGRNWDFKVLQNEGANGKQISVSRDHGIDTFNAVTETNPASQNGNGATVEAKLVMKEELALFDDSLESSADVSNSISVDIPQRASAYKNFSTNSSGSRKFYFGEGHAIIHFEGSHLSRGLGSWMNQNGVLYRPRDMRLAQLGLMPLNLPNIAPWVENPYINTDRYCLDNYRTANCESLVNYYLYVNGRKVSRVDSISDFITKDYTFTDGRQYPFEFTLMVPYSELENHFNLIEIKYEFSQNSQKDEWISRFNIYVEPKECSLLPPTHLKASGYCAGNIRFSIDDLPLQLVLSPSSNITLEGSNIAPAKLDGVYTLSKHDVDTVKWKKENDVEWKYVPVGNWKKDSLGFELYAFSNSAFHIQPELNLRGVFSISLTDGNNSAELLKVDRQFSSRQRSDLPHRSIVSVSVDEISRSYPKAARGGVFSKVVFKNDSARVLEAKGKYILVDSNGLIASEGEFEDSLPPGFSEKELVFESLADVNKDYSVLLELSYGNESKLSSVSFSGNNGPAIFAPTHIFADAFDTVEIDYSVVDVDNDAIEVDITSPFSISNNKWQTTENDIGLHEVLISASDGISEIVKKITIEVGPPKVECSMDADCGNTITLEGRVCEEGSLFAKELNPVCVNPGTFHSHCSSIDVNRVYGKCSFRGEFNDGDINKFVKFSGAQKKDFFIELPGKSIVKNAFIELKGKPKTSQCFDAVKSFDEENSTAVKYNFANGAKFVALPLGDPVLVGSLEQNSDRLEGFPQISFTPPVEGVAHSISVNIHCGDTGSSGGYIELSSPCEAGVLGVYTPNLVNSCSRGAGWISRNFSTPISNAEMSDFCAWGSAERTISFTTNLNTVYNGASGYYGGIGNSRPAFRAYAREFQDKKELYLGEKPVEVKKVSFSVQEDLKGQEISYSVTADGGNWVGLQNNSSVDFGILDTGRTFNWKAILNTANPAKTPRINSAQICIDTFGLPDNVGVQVGSELVQTFGANGPLDSLIDITSALNTYLFSLPEWNRTVVVPISLSSDSEGVVDIVSIGYEFDVNLNHAPDFNAIPNAEELYIGDEIRIDVFGSDPDNDHISYSIDSNLFSFDGFIFMWLTDSNSAGDYNFTITASDGINSVSKIVKVKVSSPPVIAFECTDPDGGLNYYSKSTASCGSFGSTSFFEDVCLSLEKMDTTHYAYIAVDYCAGGTCFLQEGYIDGNEVKNSPYNCENGCRKGLCLQNPSVPKRVEGPGTNIFGVPAVNPTKPKLPGLVLPQDNNDVWPNSYSGQQNTSEDFPVGSEEWPQSIVGFPQSGG